MRQKNSPLIILAYLFVFALISMMMYIIASSMLGDNFRFNSFLSITFLGLGHFLFKLLRRMITVCRSYEIRQNLIQFAHSDVTVSDVDSITFEKLLGRLIQVYRIKAGRKLLIIDASDYNQELLKPFLKNVVFRKSQEFDRNEKNFLASREILFYTMIVICFLLVMCVETFGGLLFSWVALLVLLLLSTFLVCRVVKSRKYYFNKDGIYVKDRFLPFKEISEIKKVWEWKWYSRNKIEYLEIFWVNEQVMIPSIEVTYDYIIQEYFNQKIRY